MKFNLRVSTSRCGEGKSGRECRAECIIFMSGKDHSGYVVMLNYGSPCLRSTIVNYLCRPVHTFYSKTIEKNTLFLHGDRKRNSLQVLLQE